MKQKDHEKAVKLKKSDQSTKQESSTIKDSSKVTGIIKESKDIYNQAQKYFEIKESSFFEDVPEDENILGQILSDKSVELISDTFENMEPASKVRKLTDESHETCRSLRTYSKATKVSNQKNDNTNSLHSDIKNRPKNRRKGKESTDLPQTCESISTPEVTENKSLALSSSEKKLNSPAVRVYLVQLPKRPQTKEEIDSQLMQVAKSVTKSEETVSVASTSCNKMSDKGSHNESKVRNSSEVRNSNLEKYSPRLQVKKALNSPIKYPSDLSLSENMQPRVSLMDYRKQCKKQLNDKDLSDENVSNLKVPYKEINTKNTDKQIESDLDFQSSAKSKRVSKRSEISVKKQNVISVIKEKSVSLQNGIHQLPESAESHEKSITGLQKNLVNLSQDFNNYVTNHHEGVPQTSFNFYKTNANTLKKNVTKKRKISVSKFSAFAEGTASKNIIASEMSIVVKEGDPKKCKNKEKKPDKSKTASENSDLHDVDKTSAINKCTETTTGSSNRKHLSLMDIMKRYSEKVCQPSEPEVLPGRQDFIQNMLAYSDKEPTKSVRIFKKGLNIVSPIHRERLSTNKTLHNIQIFDLRDNIDAVRPNVSDKVPCERGRSLSKIQSPSKSLTFINRRSRSVSAGSTNEDTNCNAKDKTNTRTRAASRRKTQKEDSVLITDEFDESINSESSPLTVVKNKKTKKRPMTISSLLSSRIQTRKTCNSQISNVLGSHTKDSPIKSETSRMESCVSVQNDNETSLLKRKEYNLMHSINDFVNSKHETNAVRRSCKRSQTSAVDDNSFELTLQTKRRKRSASVGPNMFLDAKSDYDAEVSKNKKYEEMLSFNKRVKRSASVEPRSPNGAMSDQDTKVFAKTKDYSLNSPSVEFNSSFDTKINLNAEDSTRRHEFSSKNYLRRSTSESCLNKQKDAPVLSRNKMSCEKNEQKLHKRKRTRKNRTFMSEAPDDIDKFNDELNCFKNENGDSTSMFETPDDINEHQVEDRSHSIDNENNVSVNNSHAEVPSRESASEVASVNQQTGYRVMPFPAQDPNIPMYNPVNNSLYPVNNIYGNSVVPPVNSVMPQVINPTIYPYSNPLFVQPQNPYQVHNSYGNSITPLNSFASSQSSVTLPIYQTGPMLQQPSNFQYNNSPNTNFMFQAGTANSSNNLIGQNFFPNSGNFSNSGGRKIPIIFQHSNVTEKVEFARYRKYSIHPPEKINVNEALMKLEQKITQDCFHDVFNMSCKFFILNPSATNLSVKEFYSDPVVLSTLIEKICEMTPEFDSFPQIEYIFDDAFFESPIREAMKDYIDFHLQTLYKKPALRDKFVQKIYKKFPFRDCVYLCSAFPKDNVVFNQNDLIYYLTYAAFFAILDECKRRELL